MVNCTQNPNGLGYLEGDSCGFKMSLKAPMVFFYCIDPPLLSQKPPLGGCGFALNSIWNSCDFDHFHTNPYELH